MKKSALILLTGCLILLAAGITAGCIGTTTTVSDSQTTTAVTPKNVTPAAPETTLTLPVTTAAPSTGSSFTTIFVNNTADEKVLIVPANDRVIVRLTENPTTGYEWNATVSKGLTVIGDTYTAPDSDLMGAAGYHEWILAPSTVDTYTFKAVSLRPWEGATLDDKTFSLAIVAMPE